MAMQGSEEARSGPLTGYRVIELGTMIAGPFCGRMLADFGADVIKVESPDGDPVRSMGKRVDGKSLYASTICRNKRMVQINLRSEAGRDLVRKMVAKTDILIENFRPGTMERWGLGYEELSAINPGLVMVRISGYGQTGPYRMRAGYGIIGESMSGLRHLTGDEDRPPSRVSTSLTDYIAGITGAYGAAMALLSRHATGKGQVVDMALYEASFNLMEPYVPAYDKLGVVANRTGSKLPDSVVNNLFVCGDGRPIHIAAQSEPTWQRLCEVMDRPDLLADPRFATVTTRTDHQDEIDAEVQSWTDANTMEAVEAALDKAGVPASRIYTVADIFRDQHYAARAMIVEVPDDELGSTRQVNVVPKLSATPGRIRRGGGQPGRDTRAVLRQELGLSDSVIDEMVAADVVRCATANQRTAAE